MAPRFTGVAAVQPISACFFAASFLAELGEVIWVLDIHYFFGVSWATQTQSRAHRVFGAQHIDDLAPHLDGRVRVCIPDEIHPMLRPAEEDVDAI